MCSYCQGCYDEVKDQLEEYLYILGIVVLVIGFLQVRVVCLCRLTDSLWSLLVVLSITALNMTTSKTFTQTNFITTVIYDQQSSNYLVFNMDT